MFFFFPGKIWPEIIWTPWVFFTRITRVRGPLCVTGVRGPTLKGQMMIEGKREGRDMPIIEVVK